MRDTMAFSADVGRYIANFLNGKHLLLRSEDTMIQMKDLFRLSAEEAALWPEVHDLLTDPIELMHLKIQELVAQGRTRLVKTILHDQRVDPNQLSGWPFLYAAQYGHTDMVRFMLSSNRLVFHYTTSCTAIGLAANNNHLEIVRILLDHPGVRPTYNGNFALEMAIKQKHVEIVRLLFEDGRVRSTLDDRVITICLDLLRNQQN